MCGVLNVMKTVAPKAGTKSLTLLLSLRVYQTTAATKHSFLLQNHLNHKTGYCKTLLFQTIDCVVFISLLQYLHFLMRITLKPQLLHHKQKHRENKHTRVLQQKHCNALKKILY